MRSSFFAVIAVVLLITAFPASAGDETITFFDSAFLPTATNIAAGDTVTFEWASGTHIVTSGEPGDPDAGDLFEVTLDSANPTFSFTFNFPGIVSFHCQLHPLLTGTIIIEPVTIEVDIIDTSFSPQHEQIFQGDQVQWNWIEGIHTVTSGASSDPGDNPGALFDALSTQAQPVFIYQFDDPGLVPYFCIPHEDMGMNGTILVQRLFIRGDFNTDGTVGLVDVIDVLAYLFQGGQSPTCFDAADGDDDGQLGLVDAICILNYLFVNGDPLPDPFPNEGPDRTDDDLLCE